VALVYLEGYHVGMRQSAQYVRLGSQPLSDSSLPSENLTHIRMPDDCSRARNTGSVLSARANFCSSRKYCWMPSGTPHSSLSLAPCMIDNLPLDLVLGVQENPPITVILNHASLLKSHLTTILTRTLSTASSI